MIVDFSILTPRAAYGWMTGTILPRPIAWVSTISPDGRPNLAPFSFFQGITANPPTLMFVPVNTRDGAKKDTLRNLELVPEFVVNLVPFALAESEFAHFGVAQAPSLGVKPPRVALAPVAFECTVHQIVLIGEGPLAANVVFGRIQLAHVRDDVLSASGEPDPAKLDLIGRLGGESYTRTTGIFDLKRPDRR
jgi:flavin reductase (DIM6/NTAB) family NADH-FMN oxidoreductase RutF